MYEIELLCGDCGHIWIGECDDIDGECPECGSQNLKSSFDDSDDYVKNNG